MFEYDEECLIIFMKNQSQLLGKEIITTKEEADEFLTDCMAQICKNAKEVMEYLEEAGMDISHMSESEVLDQAEVFPMTKGRYLVVEG